MFSMCSNDLRSIRSIIREKFQLKKSKVENFYFIYSCLESKLKLNQYISYDREKNRLSNDVLIVLNEYTATEIWTFYSTGP